MRKIIAASLLTISTLQAFAQELTPVKGPNDKYGFKDSKGHLAIEYKYTTAGEFAEGLAEVRLNGKSGFINQQDQPVIPFTYDDVEDFNEGLAAVQMGGKWGYIDQTNKLVIPNVYDKVHKFSEGLAAVAPVAGAGFGYINKTGKMVIPVQFRYAYPFSDGVAMVNLARGTAHINAQGALLDDNLKPIASAAASSPAAAPAATPEKLDRHELAAAYRDAISKKAPVEARRQLAGKLQRWLNSSRDYDIIEYTYIGDLLRDAEGPQDVQQAVQAYDYFLRHVKDRYGYSFPNDYPDAEVSLALLLISKYYYYWKTGELPMNERLTIAEAARWFNNSFTNLHAGEDYIPRLKRIAGALDALQHMKVSAVNQQAYSDTKKIIDYYSGMFFCKLGDELKYNKQQKKLAKHWYNQALALGFTDASDHLARINDTRPQTLQGYGYPSANYKEQTLERPAATGRSSEGAAYDEWWDKTYGKGGTQNSTPMPNNNVPQPGYRTGTTSEAERHQRAMDQIYHDTRKQMERSFSNGR